MSENENIQQISSKALAEISSAQSLSALEEIRIAYLGKKGHLTDAMKVLATLTPDEKKSYGAAVNQAKSSIELLLAEKKEQMSAVELESKLAQDKIDVTLPHRPYNKGVMHPISKVIAEVAEIFAAMGFDIAEGPEIEDDYHNFTALNFPHDHPAREMHDTFYLTDAEGKPSRSHLLRTHTSTVQIRTMKSGKPPFRVIAPGRTYRSDSDMTHTPMFNQIEGLVIDKNITMAHLKGTLQQFINDFFGSSQSVEIPVRFRASFFPFTEPSAEVDIGCSREGGVVKIGKGSDWLEILGCGMVHPNVLKNCDINPDDYQGFAFGMGVERLAMLKYGMPDLRAFFDNDVRWIKHYGFS